MVYASLLFTIIPMIAGQLYEKTGRMNVGEFMSVFFVEQLQGIGSLPYMHINCKPPILVYLSKNLPPRSSSLPHPFPRG